ncbi:hypothetical protein CDAR_499481 [Caerostris darwini]|uniref:Uncharacterized protein n=1 Tax=Caerostris darwini TaxID=1538125 RepID=A0AAV4SE58_9ARAC|nr:hypothetical protein CDAR_499481 [Caerostris darwini]
MENRTNTCENLFYSFILSFSSVHYTILKQLASLRNTDLADTHTSLDCNYASCLLFFGALRTLLPLLRTREGEESVTVQSPVCFNDSVRVRARTDRNLCPRGRDARTCYSW